MPKRKFYGSRRNTQVTLEPELAIAIIGKILIFITSYITSGSTLRVASAELKWGKGTLL